MVKITCPFCTKEVDGEMFNRDTVIKYHTYITQGVAYELPCYGSGLIIYVPESVKYKEQIKNNG